MKKCNDYVLKKSWNPKVVLTFWEGGGKYYCKIPRQCCRIWDRQWQLMKNIVTQF